MSNLRDILSKYEIKDLEPSKDCILWRYTDIPSLIEILTGGYIPLVKVSLLSDPAEGAILRSALNKAPGATDFGKSYAFDVYKKTSFVSCWCKNKEELAPMWERFSPRDGVAIKTTAKRLLECLSPLLATNIGVTSIKYVKYIDESPDDIFSDLAELDLGEFEKFRRDLFFYKLSDFSDEREVRIFREKTPPLLSRLVTADPTDQHRLEQFFKNTHAIQKEDVFPGRSRLNDLITEIVISPTAHSGIFTIVKDLLKSLNEMRASKGYSVFDIKVKESRRKMWYKTTTSSVDFEK